MFQEDKYYTHSNFLDVYIHVLVKYPNDRYYISWYNKNWQNGKFWIDNEVVTIKSNKNWSEYAPK